MCLIRRGRLHQSADMYIPLVQPTLPVTADELDDCMSGNLKSIFHSVDACVPSMIIRGRGGSIINVARIWSRGQGLERVWSHTSRAAITGVSLSFAIEQARSTDRSNPFLEG